MSDAIITAENLSKAYVLGHAEKYDTFFRSAFSTITAPFRNYRDLRRLNTFRLRNHEENNRDILWALKDVSFEVKRGEVIGIIGRNGAGKSTLLKILSRIAEPTRGRGIIRGRVSALLEVGTGFHPDLTGRENIYLNGTILGMRKKEIDSKFDEIVAFSGVERFIDTLVKRYSSGMQVRLAFAVAAHLEPEILIIDEVLAVGDSEFQKKCLGKMQEVSSGEGRTVLFVSHNLTAVKSLCTRSIALLDGKIIMDDDTETVISSYLSKTTVGCVEKVWNTPEEGPGDDIVRLHRAAVLRDDGGSNPVLDMTTPIRLEFEFWNLAPDTMLNLSILVNSHEGVCVFNTTPRDEKVWHGKRFPGGLFRSVVHIPGGLLNEGSYQVTVMAVIDRSRALFQCEDVIGFDIQDLEPRTGWQGKISGVVHPRLTWETQLLSDLDQ